MTAARIIEAIGSLLWPLLVAVLLIRVIPHVPGVVADLRKAMRTRRPQAVLSELNQAIQRQHPESFCTAEAGSVATSGTTTPAPLKILTVPLPLSDTYSSCVTGSTATPGWGWPVAPLICPM